MASESGYQRFACALGMASFQAQSLEHSIVSLFAATFVLNEGMWKPEVRKIMDTRYSQTLGRLIKDASKSLNLPEALALKLEEALKERNWVTHHFFREYGGLGVNDQLLIGAIVRLENLWPFFETVAGQVNELVVQRRIETGLSREQVLKDIDKALELYVYER